MKVLHILNELKFSGAEIMYVAAAPVFQKLGCELSVVNTAKDLGEYASFFENAGYKVYHWWYPGRTNFNYWRKWIYYWKVIRFLKKEHYDVVHIHRSDMKWGMSYCAWRSGCKPVYTFHNVFHSHWYSYVYHWWLRWSAKHLFGCVFQTISDSVYDNEKEYYHDNTIKIYNWYDSNRFFPAQKGERELVKNKLGILEMSPVLISIGGCSPIKRHIEIIKALPEIIKVYPNIVYLHLGQGNSLEEEKYLAKELNVDKHIRFCGNQVNVRKYLIASDIYLMTSTHEGIPITTIEAMACGIPAILYDVPGLRDFNKSGECSVLIKEDYHLLAQKIIELYQDKEQRQILIRNAKTFVDSNFYMQTNANKIFELYQK